MKAYRFLLLLCLLLSLTATAAAQEYVSIAELHAQAESMGGRWKKTYETPNGELEIDAPVIVPDIAEIPVITVERAIPFNNDMLDIIQSGKLVGGNSPEYQLDYHGDTYEIALATHGNGLTTDRRLTEGLIVSRGIWISTSSVRGYQTSTPETYHYPWTIDPHSAVMRNSEQTVAQAMSIWQSHIDVCYPGRNLVIQPKRITVNGSLLSNETGDSKTDKRDGWMNIRAEQVIGGLPIMGPIASFDGENNFRIPYTGSSETNKISDRLHPYRTGSFWKCYNMLYMHTTDSGNYSAHTLLTDVRSVEHDDVPLAPLDSVIAAIEKEVLSGNIRHVYSLRLGYLLYSNPDMTDHAWAIPRWVVDCNYITKDRQAIIDNFYEHLGDDEFSIWSAPEFVQIPIDAQSGDMIIFTTGDEETFSVPKLVTWDSL